MKCIKVAIFAATLLSVGAYATEAQASPITLTPPHLSMYVGETKTVQLSGGGSISYIGTNGRPDIAGGFLKDSVLTVSAYYPGEGNISVCSYVESALTCASLNVSVLKKAEPQSAGEAKITFSKSNVTVDIGQSLNLTVEGSRSGAYYISTNSNPEAIYVGISGNIITVIGSKIGGANVTICQYGGACGNIYGYVAPTEANNKAIQSTLPPVPVLTAFYVASNNVGGDFASAGATLSFKFNTSHDISSYTMYVGDQKISATGTGTGPFNGTYIVTGKEALPLSVTLEFTTSKGMTGNAAFTMGSKSAKAPAGEQGSVAKFSRNLQTGSKGADVSSLQSYLKKVGLYDGPVTGTFGNLTEAAVKKYQTKYNLKPVGVIGPATREILNKEI